MKEHYKINNSMLPSPITHQVVRQSDGIVVFNGTWNQCDDYVKFRNRTDES